MADEPTQQQPAAATQNPPPPPVQAATQPAPAADKDLINAAQREAEALRSKLQAAESTAQKLQEEKAAAERKRMEEEGKWKELAEKETLSRKELEANFLKREQEFVERQKVSELRARLAVEGVEDLDYYLLADRHRLEYVDGQIKNMDEVINDLKTAKPHIFTKPKHATATTVTANNPAPAGKVEELPTKDVRKMSPEEYRDYKRTLLRELKFGKRRA